MAWSGRVFVSDEVAAAQELYRGLLDERSWRRSPAQQLRRQAARLADGHRTRHPAAFVELTCWHPRLRAQPADAIWSAQLSAQDFLATLAAEHGYRDWAGVEASTQRPSIPFEKAVEAVVDGDLATLGRLLDDEPDLASQRSHWRHRATLLHYVAANGVETHRQRVPENAAAVAGLLLAGGADADAVADIYGGGCTALMLLRTSSHPARAGVADAVAAAVGRPSTPGPHRCGDNADQPSVGPIAEGGTAGAAGDAGDAVPDDIRHSDEARPARRGQSGA